MMTLIRRHPIQFPGSLLDQFFNDACQCAPAQAEEGTLPLDISEDERNVIVRASIPGFARENVEVEVHQGVLTIKATHNQEREEKTERYHRRERSFTSMSRQVALPSTVEDNKAQAELKDGVLTLHIPKSEQAQPRKVQIK